MHCTTKKATVTTKITSNEGPDDSSYKYTLVSNENHNGGTSAIGWVNPNNPNNSVQKETSIQRSFTSEDTFRYGKALRSIHNSFNPSNFVTPTNPLPGPSNIIGWTVSPSNPSEPSSPKTSLYPPMPNLNASSITPSDVLSRGKTEFYTPSTLPSYPLSPAGTQLPSTPSKINSKEAPSGPSGFSPNPPSAKTSVVPYKPKPNATPKTSRLGMDDVPNYPRTKIPAVPSKIPGYLSKVPSYPSKVLSYLPPNSTSMKSHFGIDDAPNHPRTKISAALSKIPGCSSKMQSSSSKASSYQSNLPNYPSKIPNYPSKVPNFPSKVPNYPSKVPNYASKVPSYPPTQPKITGYAPITSKSTGPVKPPITVPNNSMPAKTGTYFGKALSRFSSKSKLGKRGSGIRARGIIQDFHQIRAELLSSGELFEDQEFPAVDSSIFFSKSPPRPFEWKRPIEISENPKLFVDGATRFDVQQGELGDCWLLAAVANLTLSKGLFAQIVPDDQGFGDQYAGIFHFRFWQYGRWVDVVIDDRLPTNNGKLVFLHSPESNEFWSALLEKAYAKLHGSYEALDGGSACEAMEDFTGGITETYKMNKAPPNLHKIMLKAYERSSLMGCTIEPDPNIIEAQTSEGLVKGHAYSITGVKCFDIKTPNSSGKIPLIRLRNPWGNGTEWNGAWSDKSAEWRFIPQHEKEEMGLTFEHDGEFWMSYQDFKANFSRLEICNLNPDSLVDEDLVDDGEKRKWEMSMFEGEWVRGVTAGGRRKFLETFWHNPQYNITLNDPDKDDDESKCTAIVALMQKNRRSQRRMGKKWLTIGFAMYNLANPSSLPKPLNFNFFKNNDPVAHSPSFNNLREVSCRFKLPPGSYCIVPSTDEPNKEGEFILRIFSENKNNMVENDEKVGLGEVDQRVINEPVPEVDKAKDKVKEIFLMIAGEDMEVDWMKLKKILDYAMKNETKNAGFSKDVCRSMVAMMDVDRSGKLGFQEFKALWAAIRNWKGVFKLYDKDGSKCLSAFELRRALNSAGYRLNNHILNILAHRYSTTDGMITFDDFMMCAVRLKVMMDIFRERDPDCTNTATFTMDEWLEKTLYS